MKEVSIIVPCFNAQDTINRCVKSLLHQTMPPEKMEIILVDDASTDRTYPMLLEYQKRYPHSIQVVHLEKNKRVGGARNAGIQAAVGEYIGFTDADDWVEPVMYEHMVNKALLYQTDVVRCFHKRTRQYHFFEEIHTGKKDQAIIIQNDREQEDLIASDYLGNIVCDHLYKKTFLTENNIQFPEQMAYEDTFFAMLVHVYAKKIYILEENLYHYYMNPASIVHTENPVFYQDYFKANRQKWEELEKRGLLDRYRRGIEFDYLMNCYMGGLEMLAYRFSEFPTGAFFLLKKDILDRMPDIKNNPYIPKHCNEMHRMMLELLYQDITPQEAIEVGKAVKNYMKIKEQR